MYSRIVVGTNGTDRSLIAVDHAARLAAALSAELHVVSAASPVSARDKHPSAPREVVAELSDSSARAAAKLGHDASKRHGIRAFEHHGDGEPASVLMAVADAVDADLIVVGSRRAIGQVLKLGGSVPSRLAHHCDRALLIVHTG
jgi:nucleotide-binding universal stress UspA family protein